MENTEDESEKRLTPELAELGELCGCTEKQIKFAEGMLQGMNQSEAAFHAGYAGERGSMQIRSAGSSAARCKPVQALLALAESRGLGVPNAPGDRDELKRILWAHARSKDKAHSIKASVELERIERDERAARDAEPLEPAAVLAEMAEMAPAVAVILASAYGIKFELSDKHRASYEACRRTIALDYLAEQRAKSQPSAEVEHG